MRAPGAPDAVAVLPRLPAVLGPDSPALAKSGSGRPLDSNTCFFEGQQRPHGARWAPNYDPLCSLCTCQVGILEGCTGAWFLGQGSQSIPSLSLQRRTVICDPVVCPPSSCLSPVQAPDQCCPVCPGECPAGMERVMEGPRMGDEASRGGRRGLVVTLCLHYFFGSTEKQDVRGLPGMPRSRDPGEGELEVCFRGGESRRAAAWDQEGAGG